MIMNPSFQLVRELSFSKRRVELATGGIKWPWWIFEKILVFQGIGYACNLLPIIRKQVPCATFDSMLGDSMDHVTDQLHNSLADRHKVSTKTSYPAPELIWCGLIDFGLGTQSYVNFLQL